MRMTKPLTAQLGNRFFRDSSEAKSTASASFALSRITLFKSVGIAVQDAVAVRTTLERAKQLGLGQQVPWQ
jgi:ornithine cyclodeaminase/alanine dehydrogenase-like protein (mu-crystallin family)